MKSTLVGTLVLGMTLLAGSAQAQSFMAGSAAQPHIFLGVDIGAAMGDQLESSKFVLAGNLGWMSSGLAGVEADFGFVNQIKTDHANARSLTGSLLIGKVLAQKWRPYGSVGAGVLTAVNTFKDLFVPADNLESFGVLTFGGGVMGELSPKFGIRGDLRVLRALSTEEHDDTFMFTRVTVGAYIKF